MLSEVCSAKRQVKNRIFLPLRFKPIDGKSTEQVPAALEIVFQSGQEQALAKAPGTAQEIDVPLAGETVNKVRLIDINVAALDNLLKVLYSYWVFHTHDFIYSVAKIRFFLCYCKQ